MNKKSTKTCVLKCMLIFSLLCSLTVLSVSQENDTISMQIRELSARLKLSGEQAAKINGVLLASQEQMFRDRKMFKNNVPELIEMAKKGGI
jgi:hypothetical protein